MEPENKTEMIVTDDQGKEHRMQILFTSENEERGTQYVFFYDTEDLEQNVIVMRYEGELDSGELIPIEDDEEYDEVEEVFNAWQEDPKIQELKANK